MPRPRIDLDQYQLEIAGLYGEGLTYNQIIEYIEEQHGIRISHRTINRRFRSWRLQRYQRQPATEELKNRIQVLFYEVGLEDEEMLQALQDEGFTLTRYALVRLRFELGLRRRIRSLEERQAADEHIRQLVTQELEKGVIDGYGRRYLYIHFRQQGHIIARDRLFQIYRTLNPDAVKRRLRDLQRHRGEYIVPGPNFIWSIDGYDKLKPYGIEIYACIDAYSRYVIWIYAGISNCTAVSCLRQFIQTLEDIQQQPRFVRSDRGGETVLLADAHHQLQQAIEPGLQFEECYLYGTSTANQRIEAWWGQLSKGYIFRWRNYFKSLQAQGYFSKDNLADYISILALYMPLIRTELYYFVRMWNSHSIRKQKNRPNVVVGKPYMLYNHPGLHVQNWGLSFDQDQLRTIKSGVEDWDINAFLPAETLSWCQSVLQSLSFDYSGVVLPTGEDRTAPFLEVYLQLRARVQEHIQSGYPPQLLLLETPTGARDWQERHQRAREVNLQTDPAKEIEDTI